MWMALEQAEGREHHARSADAALRAAMAHERLLQWMKLVVVRHAFDRRDRRAVDLQHRRQTTVHELSVDEHGTGPTLALAAPFLRARQMQVLTQDIEQT
jgi:hypothetical protein